MPILIVLLLAGLLALDLMWFQPAALLPVIADDLSMSYAQSGLILSVICLVAAVVGPFAGMILNRLGLKNAFSATLVFLAAGSVGSLISNNFYSLLLMRVLIGAGIGLSLPIPGVAAVSWLSERNRPLLNTVYAVLPYIATALNFSLSVKLFMVFRDDWKLTLAVPGFLILIVAAVWIFQRRISCSQDGGDGQSGFNAAGMREVLKDKQVRLICLAEACDMWGFQFLSSYLVTYLNEGGVPLEKAGAYSSVFPVAGIIAGLACGALMVASGKRKIFTWPMHLAVFTGTLMIVFGKGALRMAGIFIAGFGNAGWAPALYTMPMEFKNMTANKVGLVYSAMFSLGFLAAFVSPPLGGKIAEIIGLRSTLTAFAFFALLAAIATFRMDETHPGTAADI